jgi:hypothetical protein
MGVGARYAFRPLRYLELGVGMNYHFFYDNTERNDYAHSVELPLLIGLPLRLSDVTELVIAAQGGYAVVWFTNQMRFKTTCTGYTGSDAWLDANGVEVGPNLELFIRTGPVLDLMLGAKGELMFFETTNDVTAPPSFECTGTVIGGAVFFAAGIRIRL